MVCHIAYKCVKQITLQTVWYSFNEFHCSEKVSKCSNKIKIHFKYRKSHWSWVMKIFVNFCKFFIWFFNLFYLVFKKSKTFEKNKSQPKIWKCILFRWWICKITSVYTTSWNLIYANMVWVVFFNFAKCKQKKSLFKCFRVGSNWERTFCI